MMIIKNPHLCIVAGSLFSCSFNASPSQICFFSALHPKSRRIKGKVISQFRCFSTTLPYLSKGVPGSSQDDLLPAKVPVIPVRDTNITGKHTVAVLKRYNLCGLYFKYDIWGKNIANWLEKTVYNRLEFVQLFERFRITKDHEKAMIMILYRVLKELDEGKYSFLFYRKLSNTGIGKRYFITMADTHPDFKQIGCDMLAILVESNDRAYSFVYRKDLSIKPHTLYFNKAIRLTRKVLGYSDNENTNIRNSNGLVDMFIILIHHNNEVTSYSRDISKIDVYDCHKQSFG
jgi:hypothetical protein